MADEDNRFRSYASRVSTKAKENKSSGSSGFTSSSGSQNRNDNARKSDGQHKLEKSLNKLQAQGKGDTEQAKVLKRYLSGVVSPHDKPGGPPGQKDTRSF